MTSKSEFITRRLNAQVETSKAAIAAFTDGMQKDPAYALTWAENVFKAAARLQVAQQTLATADCLVGKGHTADEAYGLIREETILQVVRSACYISSSTSRCTNEMTEQLKTAQAELVEALS